jgi:SAM-dependent methyltransferase
MNPCSICGGTFTPAYRGPIRQGTFGRSAEGTIWRCDRCGVEYLPPAVADLEAFYQGEEYRRQVGEEPDVEDFFRRHDAEQLPRLALFEGVPLRGRVVADIGCGGGSFLDLLRGVAGTTIGIEPMAGYHRSLAARGHRTYPGTAAALADWAGRVDVAVSFSVVEHVADPKGFLAEIRALLAPGGRLILSTPNRCEVLMRAGPEAYKGFFYRAVHTHYFDAPALENLARAAGFSDCRVRFVHRFNFANFLGWMRDGKPTQNAGASPLSAGFDAVWRAALEEQGLADYLYAELRP